MTTTNKELIEKKLRGTEFIIGGFNDKMEQLTPANLKKVIDNMTFGTTDIDVKISRKPFVVEVAHVDNEIDFSILSKEEYIGRYGNERYES